MKNLVIASFLNFGIFFFFLINPNNIFSANIVNWVSWITGILNVIFFVLVLDFVVQKNQKIISLQDEIIASETDDKEIYSDLDKAQKELESFKNQDDSEFKKSNVPGVCENYKEYFDLINETHHGPPK
jgi:hypothetical protein